MPVVITAEVLLASCSPASTPLAICTFPAQSIALVLDNIDKEAIAELPKLTIETVAGIMSSTNAQEFKAKFC